jgi:hypothetical protein
MGWSRTSPGGSDTCVLAGLYATVALNPAVAPGSNGVATRHLEGACPSIPLTLPTGQFSLSHGCARW